MEESAKDITKLHYRGKYDDFPAWHIGIMKAMRKLNISRVIAADKPAIELVRSRNPDKNPSEHADILWDMQREHGVQLTELHYLVMDTIIFDGPLKTMDESHFASTLVDTKTGLADGITAYSDIVQKSQAYQNGSIIAARGNAYDSKHISSEVATDELVTIIITRYEAWERLPETQHQALKDFFSLVTDTMPVQPYGHPLPLMRVKLFELIDVNVENIESLSLPRWEAKLTVRDMMEHLTTHAPLVGMPAAAKSATPQFLAAASNGYPPLVDDKTPAGSKSKYTAQTNDCNLCTLYICTGKGPVAGKDKDNCMAWNCAIPTPADASKMNIKSAMAVRAYCKENPSANALTLKPHSITTSQFSKLVTCLSTLRVAYRETHRTLCYTVCYTYAFCYVTRVKHKCRG